MSTVRVRFAPSPTGPLHMGGVRTALFNYLFAKKNNGTFVLRIEDTDQNRFVPGAEEYIIESLKWCGISPEEGVGFGNGSFGPYRQSERRAIYKEYSEKLVNSGWAYYAFDTPEELNNIRSSYEAGKKTFIYNHTSRGSLKNSLTLSDDEVKAKISAGEAYVVRFKMPENEIVTISDIVRGDVTFNTGDLDDKILFKADGLPTYHLANVVDDYLMQISHVIRGEEWLPSLPLHALLYRAFGWEDKRPEFAHLPLILKPVGQGKLSKRDGDKMGFPVFPLQWTDTNGETSSGYREDGYLPEAFINMLALLGWNPGTDQEIFSLEELSQIFTLERVGKSGSKFDPEKTKWFNHQYLVNLDNHSIADLYMPLLKEKGISVDQDKLAFICGLVKERATFIKDLWEQSSFFFEAPESYDEKTVRKRWKEQTPDLMQQLISVLEKVEIFDTEHTEEAVKNWITENELGMGAIMNAFRLAIVGEGKGPHMFDIIAILGKEETIRRLKKAIEVLP
ncbi:glutamate--tRNA ligase [Saccharicrinis sp. FJH62]|uniref:glutamate--tRNA ligase n=1 Tax=Saccharicrinis sp. FJH62 TaxID=3344657 RepID=UPI0035D43E5E